jgi:hypothetical protein
MSRVFLLLIVLLSIRTIGYSQEQVIINRGVDTFYANIPQLMVIEFPNRDSAEIIVESSQGAVNSMDNGRPIAELFNIGGLKKGKVLIKIYGVNSQEKKLLGQRTFIVSDRPLNNEEKNYSQLKVKPIITFCGVARGPIFQDSLKTVKSLFITAPFKLKSATVYFGDHDVITSSLNSSNLSSLFELFKRCQDGSIITFTQIKLIKGTLIYDAPDMTFTVKEKL